MYTHFIIESQDRNACPLQSSEAKKTGKNVISTMARLRVNHAALYSKTDEGTTKLFGHTNCKQVVDEVSMEWCAKISTK